MVQNSELSELRVECSALRTQNANMERLLQDNVVGNVVGDALLLS